MGSAPAGGMANKVTGANAAAYQGKNPNVTSAKMTPKIQAHPVAYPTAAAAPKLTSAHGGLGQGYQMSGKDGGPALPKPINWAALAPKPAVAAAPAANPAVAAAAAVEQKQNNLKKSGSNGIPQGATPGPANTSGYYLPGSSNLWFDGGSGDHWKGGSGGVKNAAQVRAQTAGKAHYNDPRNVLARKLANKKSAANKNKKKPKYTSSRW